MRITVQTDHPVVTLGLTKDAPAGVAVSAPPVMQRRGISIPQVPEIVIHVAKEVEIALLLATWLYDKVRRDKQRTHLRINRIEIRCDEDEIRRIVIEQIDQETGD